MKTVELFYLPACPYCAKARKAIEELKTEAENYGRVPVRWINEAEEADYASEHDYYHVPTVYFNGKKVFEAHPGDSLQKIKAGEAVRKEIREDGVRKQKYVQLDPETNSLIIKDAHSVKISEKLKDMEKINDIELGTNQKQAAVEGKPVELAVGDQKVVDKLTQKEGHQLSQKKEEKKSSGLKL